MDDTKGIFSRPERLLSCWSDWMPFVQLEVVFFRWTCQIQLVLVSVNDVWSSLWGPEPLRCIAGTQHTGKVCNRLSSQGQPWNGHSMCPGGSLSVVSEYSWRGPLLTPKPSHLCVKHSHFQQWKIADVSRVASANRRHFPQHPIPCLKSGVSRRQCGLSRRTHSLWNSTVETTATLQTPPQEKGCRRGSKETARKIPRGGCDSMPLGKRGLQSSREPPSCPWLLS